MPLNCEFSWGQAIAPCVPTFAPQTTCFQILGTKRKASKTDQGEETLHAIGKRQCQGVSYVSTAFRDVNQEEMGQVQSYKESTQTDDQEQMECSQYQENSSNNNNELQKKSQEVKDEMQFIQDMNMESNDYWCAPLSYMSSALKMQEEVEEARIRMESDYTPNTTQCAAENIPPLHSYIRQEYNKCYILTDE